MKHKQPTHAKPNLRSIGYLTPTSKRNRKRFLSPEDRFSLLCLALAVILSALLVAVES